MVSMSEKLERKQQRREKRILQFSQWRDQTKSNSSCFNCFWLEKSWGQTPCKCCSRFDSSRPSDKFKRQE